MYRWQAAAGESGGGCSRLVSLPYVCVYFFFFFSSRRRHTRLVSDWSSDVCSSDLGMSFAVRGLPCHLQQRVSGSEIVAARYDRARLKTG